MQRNGEVGLDIEVLVQGQPSTMMHSAMSDGLTVPWTQTDIAQKDYVAVHVPKSVDESTESESTESTVFLLPPTNTPSAVPVSHRPPIAVIATGVCSLCSLLALIFVIFGVVTKWFTLRL